MRRIHISSALSALLLAVVLFVLGGILHPGFANYGLVINILRLAAFLGIVAIGQTLVIISGGEGIDLSVGAVVTLGAIIIYRFTNGHNELFLPALLLALGVGALIGLINGIGVTALRIPPLVMTLGMTGVVQGLILAVTQGQMIGDAPPFITDLVSGSLILGIPGVLPLWIIIGLGTWLLLERTRYGKHLFAIGVNRATALLSGVRVSLVVVLTYTLSGLLAALGGVILLGYTHRVFLNLGEQYTLPSVAAVVVGGTLLAGGVGGYGGTMAGALVLTVLTSLLTTVQLPEALRMIVYGVVLLLLLAVYGRQRRLRA
ncbi:ABC transporter permease [Ktedonospora formicarum]|uniref:Sugar ABC transporter permease n=1 Tax=Ktedonospora formicarum TaxID=2778364 RepID=A0A8J3IB34_9CHLR|nr:ABC transporter permease [Ktedonospora formicarum]GHO48069.1 sugar ABC transporter permease [Ktedonospora formicarum]